MKAAILPPGIGALGRLVDEFDADPESAARRMRTLLDYGRAWFTAAAVRALKPPEDSQGRRFLLGLLAAHGMLLDCLCNRLLAPDEAAALARLAETPDRPADIWIARMLGGPPGTRPDDAAAARLLEILERVSHGPGAAPLLMPLLSHDNPHIRSKAALLIGKASRNVRWVEHELSAADARVRANAIEALWRNDGDADARRPVFREAVADPHCRIAANGAVGLYLLGDAAGVRALLEISCRSAPECRAAAAWGMGETGDPRFLACLNGLLHDGEGKVRQNALRAISRIRQNAARTLGAGVLRVEVEQAGLEGGWRRLLVTVADSAGRDPGPLAATRFTVSEDGSLAGDYDVAAMPPETQACGLPHRYEIRYRAAGQAAAEPREVKVRVHCDAGAGEGSLTLDKTGEEAACEAS